MARLPTFADVQAASARLAGHAVVTPVLESGAVNDMLGGRLLLKVEALQHAGSFKFRGAFNRLCQLSEKERARGVVAFSSGNHAQGVACAARLLGVSSMIVMPVDAPSIKVEATRGYGAEVLFYDRYTESREEIASRLARERGATLVPSFDDFDIIAGQGTVGLEMVQQAGAGGTVFDEVVINAGGGGLIAGCSLAVQALSPTTQIWSAEPSGFNDHERSLAAGRRLSNSSSSCSFCDALLAPEPGELTFEINRETLTGGVSATDTEVGEAMAFAFRHFKIVLEPGGAVALASVLTKRRSVQNRTIGVVCSGGNVAPKLFIRVLESHKITNYTAKPGLPDGLTAAC